MKWYIGNNEGLMTSTRAWIPIHHYEVCFRTLSEGLNGNYCESNWGWNRSCTIITWAPDIPINGCKTICGIKPGYSGSRSLWRSRISAHIGEKNVGKRKDFWSSRKVELEGFVEIGTFLPVNKMIRRKCHKHYENSRLDSLTRWRRWTKASTRKTI